MLVKNMIWGYGCLMLLLAGQSTYAQDSIAMKTVKEIYDLGKRYEKGMEVIELFADESLQRAFNLASSYEYICGYDYDVLWQSQDPEYQRNIHFTQIGSDQIRVNLAKAQWHKASSVGYKMNCQNGVCKINDIVDEYGSLKARIQQQCR